MKKLLAAIFAMLAVMHPAALSDPKQSVMAWMDSNVSTLNRVNRNIWGWAETGLEEVKSSKELQDLLRSNGFAIDSGVASAERKARPEVMAGHGCGHSVFGTASTGAA